MPETVLGLPLHPLIVHGTVIIVPVAAIAVLLFAFWPRFRSWSGPLTPVLAVLALVLVPLSTSTGETLEHKVEESALVETHAELGETLLPLVIAMTVLAIGLYWLTRPRPQGAKGLPKGLAMAAAALATVASVGTLVHVVRIGHSGASAAWSDVVSSAPSDPESFSPC
jgi:hypothetical protein